MELTNTTTEISDKPMYKGTWHEQCVNGRLSITTGTDKTSGCKVEISTDADTGKFLAARMWITGTPGARRYTTLTGLKRALANAGAGKNG